MKRKLRHGKHSNKRQCQQREEIGKKEKSLKVVEIGADGPMSLSSGAIRRIAASEKIPHELGGYGWRIIGVRYLKKSTLMLMGMEEDIFMSISNSTIYYKSQLSLLLHSEGITKPALLQSSFFPVLNRGKTAAVDVESPYPARKNLV